MVDGLGAISRPPRQPAGDRRDDADVEETLELVALQPEPIEDLVLFVEARSGGHGTLRRRPTRRVHRMER